MSTANLKRLLNVKRSVIPAPMAGVSGGLLAAAASDAGSIGFIGVGHSKLDFLRKELDLARIKGSGAKIGAAYLCWRLEEMDEKDAFQILDYAIDDPLVGAIWFSFGRQNYKWIDYVASKSNQIKICLQVATAFEIEEAFKVGKAIDILCIQGYEAGGHGSSHGGPIRQLFSLANDLRQGRLKPLLLAAGGVGNAQDVKELLAMPGCSGVVSGTRFAASTESLYPDALKNRLIEGQPEQTYRSKYYDNLRGTLGWPEHIDGRGFPTSLLKDLESGKVPLENAESEYKKLDQSQAVLWGGLGVASVKNIKSVKEILDELCN